jgi:hypothetical protein
MWPVAARASTGAEAAAITNASRHGQYPRQARDAPIERHQQDGGEPDQNPTK